MLKKADIKNLVIPSNIGVGFSVRNTVRIETTGTIGLLKKKKRMNILANQSDRKTELQVFVRARLNGFNIRFNMRSTLR